MKTIFWFRQDLRLKDNPGLTQAAKEGGVLPIYILDDDKMGGASQLWLHHSLESLAKSLSGKLSLFTGDPLKILKGLIHSEGISGVYWNRCYEPSRVKKDKQIEKALKKEGIDVQTFNGSLLWEPCDIHKKDGSPYKVFTPYYKSGCLSSEAPKAPLPKPRKLCLLKSKKGKSLKSLALLPKKKWGNRVKKYWRIGEEGAHQRLKSFVQKELKFYKGGRDFPARAHTSRLSPHLHFGEISPHTVWHTMTKQGKSQDTLHFKSELGWREFSYYLLYHFPSLPQKNFQKKFDRFSWKKGAKSLEAWQAGKTGVPFVDAAMRELWETGYMHNRARMVVASFLIKNLRIDWRKGAAWFWDCLVDADLANNSASWQWVAGSGADAAPYFRIFNPVTQGEKFDPQGDYTLRYVPELKKLPLKYLFAPWTAPEEVLDQAGIVLGETYPLPIVDLKESREEALRAFRSL